MSENSEYLKRENKYLKNMNKTIDKSEKMVYSITNKRNRTLTQTKEVYSR